MLGSPHRTALQPCSGLLLPAWILVQETQKQLKGLGIGRAYEHVENTGEHLWTHMGLCVSFLSCIH